MDKAPEVIFAEETHIYSVEGIVRPSVTQILRDLGFIDFSSVSPDLLEIARNRGVAVHRAVHYLEEDDLDRSTIHPDVKPYIDAYELMKQETGWKANLREKIIFNACYSYAGQLDGFGSMKRLGLEEVLPDYKSGIPQKAERYQTAAYALAIGKPYVPRCSIHLKKNGTYKIDWHRDYRDVEDWKAIIKTYHLKHRKD